MLKNNENGATNYFADNEMKTQKLFLFLFAL